jgi:tetratricopeptide (TPR) repeat protein
VLLQARIHAAQGKTADAVKGLTSLVPAPKANANLETDEDLQRIGIIASELARLKQYDPAEALYRRIVAAKPDAEFGLAVFLATRGKVAEAIQIGDRFSAKGQHVPAMNLGTAILSAAGGKTAPAQVERVKAWYSAAERADPGSLSVMLQTAQMHDLLGNPQEAIKIYRTVLAKTDLDVSQRGLILNNASFVSAIHGGDKDEALKWVEESLRLLGMRSEVQDTRGMIHYLRGEYPKAVEDLRMSVRGGPTAVKNFHLALAEAAAGNTAEAATALRDAETRGLVESDLTPPERQLLAKLKASLPKSDSSETEPVTKE